MRVESVRQNPRRPRRRVVIGGQVYFVGAVSVSVMRC
jgi:hypothetical protein